MTEVNLRSFKKNIKTLRTAVIAVNEVWDNKSVTIIETLLQNLAFESFDASNYSLESELEKKDLIINAIKKLADYDKPSTVLQWVKEEVTNLDFAFSVND